MASWSFLTNHGLVLTYIGRYPDSTGLEIAQAVGITERAARNIVADLLEAGYIEREKVGRRNSYRLNAHLPLRHPGERTATVGELLDLLWRDDNSREASQPGTHAVPTDGQGIQDKTTRMRLQPRKARRIIRG